MKKTSIVDVSNNEKFTVGLANQKNKKVFLFYKLPDNKHVKDNLAAFTNINFISYSSVDDFEKKIAAYNTYTIILIANGEDIAPLEEFVSKKKEMIYVIRFNPPPDLKDKLKVKVLFKASSQDDLENFITNEFQKFTSGPSQF